GLDPPGRAAMLDLVSRIGTEFGISVLVSSHLLGEIEQICDHLIAIDGGRLLRADSMTSFTQVSQVLVVEVDEGREDLAAALAARGLAPRPDGRALLVQIGSDATYDQVRDAVADLGLPRARRRRRRPGPAAAPAGAAAPPGGGTVPRRRGRPGRGGRRAAGRGGAR